MKRGLITWDKSEISPDVFAGRLETVRSVLRERELPALVVYSDLWRSNQARFFANYMPYFNRALLIIPADQPPTLLCGLSPRVYGWIRSVTILEDVRPAPNFAKSLLQLAAERAWTRLGMLDFKQFPHDLYKALGGGSLELIDVESQGVYFPGGDETERAMRSRALAMAREILESELAKGVGMVDHHFTGRLERQFRRVGVEDLVILLSHGKTVPAPPNGERLEENYSVSIALEYRGHWVRITRPEGSPELLYDCRAMWERQRPHSSGEPVENRPRGQAPFLHLQLGPVFIEDLSGSYPYELGRQGSIFSLQVEMNLNGRRLFYGDTIL